MSAVNHRAGTGTSRHTYFVMVMAVVWAAFGWISLTGCAEEPAKPTPTREIKTDSDRFFEKMKQDERERGAEPGKATR